jgi:hypothetical protein
MAFRPWNRSPKAKRLQPRAFRAPSKQRSNPVASLPRSSEGGAADFPKRETLIPQYQRTVHPTDFPCPQPRKKPTLRSRKALSATTGARSFSIFGVPSREWPVSSTVSRLNSREGLVIGWVTKTKARTICAMQWVTQNRHNLDPASRDQDHPRACCQQS